MYLFISDASVLIDIEHGFLANAMFSLPWQFATTDFVYEEVKQKHSHLLQHGLTIKMLSGESVSEVYRMREQFRAISVQDMSVLILAKNEGCPLLSGDKALRAVAEQTFNVEVHGTIWLVEQMLQNALVLVEDARNAFNRMREKGSRLPWQEVESMLLRY